MRFELSLFLCRRRGSFFTNSRFGWACEQLLSALISRKQPRVKKKRKLFEFQTPVLSVDLKRTRTDLLDATTGAKVQQVVKFAGIEYRCASWYHACKRVGWRRRR